MRSAVVSAGSIVVLLAASLPLAAQPTGKEWSEKWKAENRQWIALHLIGIQPDRLESVQQLISEGLAPLGFNALVLEVGYGFQFQSHPELETSGFSREQARELARVLSRARRAVDPADELSWPSILGSTTRSIAQEVPAVRRDARNRS